MAMRSAASHPRSARTGGAARRWWWWSAAYALLVLLAAGAMLLPPQPRLGSFGLALAALIGFAALAQIMLQFLLVARFPARTAAFGLDTILHAHRWFGAVALLLVIVHVLLLACLHPIGWSLFDPRTWRGALGPGWVATTALVAVIGLTLVRKRFGLSYEWWRLSHTFLGLAAALFTIIHVIQVSRFANTPGKQWFWVIGMVAAITPLAWRRLVLPARRARSPYRLSEVRELGAGYLWVQCVGEHPFVFRPGQFVWWTVRSPWSRDEHPLSIASSAEDPTRIGFLIRMIGDFTRAAARLPAGTPTFLDGPHGDLSIDRHPAPGYVFICRGAGVAPFLGILNTMKDRRDARPVLLVLSVPVDDHIEALKSVLAPLTAPDSGLDLTIIPVVSHPGPAWSGECGHVDHAFLARVLPSDIQQRHVLLCGPDELLRDAEHALQQLGIPQTHVHTERFEVA